MIQRTLPFLCIGAVVAVPAHAEKSVSPYIELGQAVYADLHGDSDVLTYSMIAAGVDASVRNNRAEAQVSYRFEHRIGYGNNSGSDSVHSGLARAAIQVVPDLLTLEGGAMATRARTDMRGAAPGLELGRSSNISNVYSFYAGPTLSKRIGELDISAAYRFGYTKVDSESRFALPIGQQRLDSYDSSTAHYGSAAMGMRPGALPFGWTISSGIQREDVSQLDQRYSSQFARLDITQPVTPTLALVGGVGYESIKISQRDPVRDAAGVPIINDKGRYVTDPASPRKLSYNHDGLIYDAGVMWRPSKRTQVEARIGVRYGSTTYIGSIKHQLSPASGIQISVYDGIQSFGRLMTDGLSRIPTNFNAIRNPLNNGFGGCVFGAQGNGACMDDVLQSVSTSNFRNRGVTALYSASRGPLSLGFGLGYTQRKFIAPRSAIFFSLNGVTDESAFASAYLGYRIDPHSSINTNVYVNYYDSGLADSGEVFGAGISSSYIYDFSRRLSASATVGLFGYDQQNIDNALMASLLLALRYQY